KDELSKVAVNPRQVRSPEGVELDAEAAEQALHDDTDQSHHAEPGKAPAHPGSPQANGQDNRAKADDVAGEPVRVLDDKAWTRLAPANKEQMRGVGGPDRIGHADAKGGDDGAQG